MALVKILDVLEPAVEDHYAVGAFNADTLEMVQAFIQAAEIERSPLILQVNQGAIHFSGLEAIAQMACFAAQKASVPVAVHLDHGKDYAQNVQALKAGVTSLGVDASMHSYQENAAVSARIAEMAHHAGLNAEAGIGYVPAVYENLSPAEVEAHKTDPAQARQFVEETHVDLLAVALGSMRSMGERKIVLDIDLLKELRKDISLPFVLHGSSGVLWDSIQEAIANGVAKVNLASCFYHRFLEVIYDELKQNPSEGNIRAVLGPAKEQVMELAREQYQLLGSNDRV